MRQFEAKPFIQNKTRRDYVDAIAGALSNRRWAQRYFCLAGAAQTSRTPLVPRA